MDAQPSRSNDWIGFGAIHSSLGQTRHNTDVHWAAESSRRSKLATNVTDIRVIVQVNLAGHHACDCL